MRRALLLILLLAAPAFPAYTITLTGASGVTAVTPRFDFTSGTVAVYVNDAFVVNLTSGVEATGGSAIALSPGDTLEYRCSAWDAITQININGDKVSGDISGWTLPSSLGYFDIRSTGVSGDISGWTLPSSLKYFDIRSTGVSGDISGWTLPSSLVNFYVYSTSVSGDISGWTLPSGLQHFFASSTGVSGDISGWTLPSSLVNFYVYSTSVSGDISGWTLPSSLVNFYVYSTSVSYGSGGAFSGVTNNLVKIDADNCGWDYLTVNRALVDLVASGISGKSLDIGDNNAGPSQTGEAARATLATRSWSLTINATVAQAPAQATLVGPANGAQDLPTSTVLDWAAAYDANDYNVYLNGSLIANTAETIYSPTLEAGTAYAWRIDPNYPGVEATTGNTWSFATAVDPEDPEEPEEPTGWQRAPIWNRTPQWRTSPAWRRR